MEYFQRFWPLRADYFDYLTLQNKADGVLIVCFTGGEDSGPTRVVDVSQIGIYHWL